MEKQSNDLTKQFIFLLAATCGIVVANMYYVQPIGTQVVESFQVSTSSIGSVTMLTQVGYALGLLFIVPLGDVLNKRRLIISMAALSSLSLLGAFFCAKFSIIYPGGLYYRITFSSPTNYYSLWRSISWTRKTGPSHGKTFEWALGRNFIITHVFWCRS